MVAIRWVRSLEMGVLDLLSLIRRCPARRKRKLKAVRRKIIMRRCRS
jgi:hypothetical protein